MSWSNEKTVIYDKFDTWTATKIKYPGVPFQQPNTAWIALNILGGEAREATIGRPTQRRYISVVFVNIFDKENNGETTMLSLADQLELLFINQNSRLTISPLEYLDFEQPYVTIGQTSSGWQQRNFIAPFSRDEFK